MLLPKDLTAFQIRSAANYIEDHTSELLELYFEQRNVFSAIIGMFGIKALDSFSVYKRHKHPDIAQQRFPDLSLGGVLDPPPQLALESKGSSRAWPVQSHFDHPGWYIVWRYLVDPTMTVKAGRAVVIWRVHVSFFDKSDWKYEGSSAGATGGGRTHTFGLSSPAEKLRDCAVFTLPNVALRGGKPILVNGAQH